MTPASRNPTPKARFQLVAANITAHHAMIEHDSFDRAADFAMLEFQKSLAEQTREGQSAMAAGFRLQGALEFLGIFKTLAEQQQPQPPRRDMDNLPTYPAVAKGN